MTNLSSIINSLPYDIFFVTADKNLLIDTTSNLENYYLVSPITNPRAISTPENLNNSGEILSKDNIVNQIKYLAASHHHQIAICPFKPSAKVSKICEHQGWKYLANPTSLSRNLEDKIKFNKLAQKFSLPVIPSTIISTSDPKLSSILAEGNSFVAQTHFGWAGKSSYLIDKNTDISSIFSEPQLIKLTPYLPGYTLLNNAVIYQGRQISSSPALQFTGIPSLTPNPFTTVGRQWPSTAPENIIDKVSQITQKFSQILIDLGYQGFFGLDFLVHEDNVYILECNPRLTASAGIFTSTELAQGINPLFFYHLAEFFDISFDPPSEENKTREQLTLSQITPKNRQNETINIYNFQHPLVSSVNYDQEILARQVLTSIA